MRDQGSRAVGLTPVQRKIAAPEPAIGTQFQAMKLGEIVGVQLQQLRGIDSCSGPASTSSRSSGIFSRPIVPLDSFHISAIVEICPPRKPAHVPIRQPPSSLPNTPICSPPWAPSRACASCSSCSRLTPTASSSANPKRARHPQFHPVAPSRKAQRTRIWSRCAAKARSSGTPPIPKP